MSDGPNEVNIPLHAHNHANSQETEKVTSGEQSYL